MVGAIVYRFTFDTNGRTENQLRKEDNAITHKYDKKKETKLQPSFQRPTVFQIVVMHVPYSSASTLSQNVPHCSEIDTLECP